MTQPPPRSAAHLPLAGVQVVELAAIGPVPFAGRLLVRLGATVTEVLPPVDRGLGVPMGAARDPLAVGKRRQVLDLKSGAGRAELLALLQGTGILLEGFRPGTLERLDLAPATLWATRPELVIGRCGGWGCRSPRRQRAGHDINFLALAGVLGAVGPEGAPVPPLNLVGDFGGAALHLALGVVAALLRARADGRGTVVDTSILEGTLSLATMLFGHLDAGLWEDRRAGNLLDGGAPFYRCYPTADDRWLAVGALEPRFFAELVARLGAQVELDRQYDRSYWPQLADELARRIRLRTRDAWDAEFRDTDACATPVLSLDEVRRHPDLAPFVDGPDFRDPFDFGT